MTTGLFLVPQPIAASLYRCRCTAITRKGRRCRNRLFGAQFWWHDEHGNALMPADVHERWKAGACTLHFRLHQARLAALDAPHTSTPKEPS